MSRLLLLFLGQLNFLGSSFRASQDLSETEPVIPDLNVNAFLGRWYQVYGSVSSSFLTFGNAGPQDTCTTADYVLDTDGKTINVLNQGIRPDGVVTKIWGAVSPVEGKPGKNVLTFDKFMRGDEDIDPPKFKGDYWIYHLGPELGVDPPMKIGHVEQEDMYAYAIVGAPLAPSLSLDRTQLFVLARDVGEFAKRYDSEVREWLEANKFNYWWNRPRRTGSVGALHWKPFPHFEEPNTTRGTWGHKSCADVEGLLPPVDGYPDPRDQSYDFNAI
mmetsp:Transcript_87165/g.154342  ORF Transcript_87165/g.154342 Transcript_87165/m.154342 type:complete len:273 (-) Transcript_87165:84-902(-)|eukprot:CAMPEP_0197636330 /NCGR_PEP_ID=MMETSP1338-20131121/11870_1 /TAXON_ID=43686 ORGANISM="Pelagodinium beii, Strain RCC1491" /NCGR_SAMPLE_ID=MMETSP1338 /ASSEMBLY_ACC=CAM_ASM_000754 /LENGTH=272 /DNA_ID=CAMNT_0043208541 /DNA_START=47 /DNA_END=865 /DNA_ORIENTATION=-